MKNDQIEKFLQKTPDKTLVKISFKTRKPFTGLFVKSTDYTELKSKNFWRIVGESSMQDYQKSKDINLAKIFSGNDITKLSV